VAMYVFEGLELLGGGVEAGDQFGVLEVLLVVLHDELAGLLVERTLGEGHDQQALNHLQDVVEGPGGRVPVLLQRVHADLALLGYVGMEDLRDEEPWMGRGVPLGGLLGKSFSTASLHLKTPPS